MTTNFSNPPSSIEQSFHDGQEQQLNTLSNSINFNLKPFYGRKNRSGDLALPRDTVLKRLNTEEEILYAVDFVAEAFNDFREEYEFKNTNANTNIRTLEPVEAWQNFTGTYERNMTDLFGVFLSSFLDLEQRYLKMTSFKGYMRLFEEFIMFFAKTEPITRSNFIASNQVSPASSGLVISLFGTGQFNAASRNAFIEDANFDFFVEGANKYGFLIDQNAPWRLVANLSSTAMQEYMRNNGTTVGSYFVTHTTPLYLNDIDSLKYFAKYYYDTYILMRPQITTTTSAGCHSNKRFINGDLIPRIRTESSTIPLKPFSQEKFDRKYGTEYWLKFYFLLRLREAGINWSMNTKKKEFLRTVQLFSLDKAKSMSYINDMVKLNS